MKSHIPSRRVFVFVLLPLLCAFCGVYDVRGRPSVTRLSLGQRAAITGGTCYNEGQPRTCDWEELACGDIVCECKYRVREEGVWQSWSAWTDGTDAACDNYLEDDDYEVEWRCKQGTFGTTNSDPNYTECGEDNAAGPYSNILLNDESALHYCFQVVDCSNTCTGSSDGREYCNIGPNTPQNHEQLGRVKKDTCLQKDNCSSKGTP